MNVIGRRNMALIFASSSIDEALSAMVDGKYEYAMQFLEHSIEILKTECLDPKDVKKFATVGFCKSPSVEGISKLKMVSRELDDWAFNRKTIGVVK
jgi:hypothetical protein